MIKIFAASIKEKSPIQSEDVIIQTEISHMAQKLNYANDQNISTE